MLLKECAITVGQEFLDSHEVAECFHNLMEGLFKPLIVCWLACAYCFHTAFTHAVMPVAVFLQISAFWASASAFWSSGQYYLASCVWSRNCHWVGSTKSCRTLFAESHSCAAVLVWLLVSQLFEFWSINSAAFLCSARLVLLPVHLSQ